MITETKNEGKEERQDAQRQVYQIHLMFSSHASYLPRI